MQKEKIIAYEGLIHLGIGTLALSIALVSQYGFGKFPCELCLLQRYPYGVAAALGLLFFLLRAKIAWKPFFRLAIIAAYLTTAGIALYHVGVEQGWITGPTGCSAKTGSAATIEELRQQIMGAALVSCKDVSAELFGISMAAWNALYAIAAAIGAGLLWRMSKEA